MYGFSDGPGANGYPASRRGDYAEAWGSELVVGGASSSGRSAEAARTRPGDVRQQSAKHAAMRRLVLAAAACEGAAQTAATAADSIAQLRRDVADSAREEVRGRLSRFGSGRWSVARDVKDRDRQAALVEADKRAAEQRADDALERYKHKQHGWVYQDDQGSRSEPQLQLQQMQLQRGRAALRHDSRADENGNATRDHWLASEREEELVEALREARAELHSARREMRNEVVEANVYSASESEALAELQAAKADLAMASEAAFRARADESREAAAIVRRLNEELSVARSKAATEAWEAAESRKALHEEQATVNDHASVAEQFRGLHKAEAAEATSLRRRLEVASTTAADAERRAAEEVLLAQRSAEAHKVEARQAEAVVAARDEATAALRSVQLRGKEEAAAAAAATDMLAVHSASRALLERREEVSRGVIASLLAYHLEHFARDAFAAWRHSMALAAGDRQAETLQAHHTSAARALDAEREEVARLRTSLTRSEAEALNAREGARAQVAAAEAQAAAVATEAREQHRKVAAEVALADSRAAASAAEAEAARVQLATLEAAAEADKAAAAEAADAAAERHAAALEERALRLRGAENEAAARGASVAAAEQRTLEHRAQAAAAEEAARVARQQAEELRSQAADADAHRERAHSAAAEAARLQALLHEAIQEAETAKLAATAPAPQSAKEAEAVAEAKAATAMVPLLWRREAMSRHVLASVLAAHLELQVRVTFSAWRAAAKQAEAAQRAAEAGAEVAQLRQQLSAWKGPAEELHREATDELGRVTEALAVVRAANAELHGEARRAPLPPIAVPTLPKVGAEHEPGPSEHLQQQLEQQLEQHRRQHEQLQHQLQEQQKQLRAAAAATIASAKAATAARGVVASLLATAAEQLVVGVFRAWRDLLLAGEDDDRPPALAPLAAPAAELTAWRERCGALQATAAQHAHNAAAARGVAFSLLATAAEDQVQEAFSRWRRAIHNPHPPQALAPGRAEPNALATPQGREADHTAATKATLLQLHARQGRAAQLLLCSVLARSWEAFLRTALLAWLGVAANQAEALRLAHQRREMEVSQVSPTAGQRTAEAAAATLPLVWRREAALRHVLASLLAANLELLVHGAFASWRIVAAALAAEAAQRRVGSFLRSAPPSPSGTGLVSPGGASVGGLAAAPTAAATAAAAEVRQLQAKLASSETMLRLLSTRVEATRTAFVGQMAGQLERLASAAFFMWHATVVASPASETPSSSLDGPVRTPPGSPPSTAAASPKPLSHHHAAAQLTVEVPLERILVSHAGASSSELAPPLSPGPRSEALPARGRDGRSKPITAASGMAPAMMVPPPSLTSPTSPAANGGTSPAGTSPARTSQAGTSPKSPPKSPSKPFGRSDSASAASASADSAAAAWWFPGGDSDPEL